MRPDISQKRSSDVEKLFSCRFCFMQARSFGMIIITCLLSRLLMFQIMQNYRLDYQAEDVNPVLNIALTPDRPLEIIFIPRDK
jgi:hypothetical protein